MRWEILDAWRDAAAEMRHPEDRRVQPRRQLRQRLLPDEPAARRALERDQGVPAPGAAAARTSPCVTGAHVERVPIETRDGQTRATGVEFRVGGGERHGRQARREVILAAGAIGSPQILQLSGIGPGALLQQHGIAVVHDLPGVGENLHDHLQIRMRCTRSRTWSR